MVKSAMISRIGGRERNEDYVAMSTNGSSYCFVLCDGLGGHRKGDYASRLVAKTITKMFEEQGDSMDFLDIAINAAQEKLCQKQTEKKAVGEMKTTLVVLVVTDEIIKWAHIGDSRLYHIYNDYSMWERTKDHSVVQRLKDTGEIIEEDIRNHPERNIILRAMGAVWNDKSYDKSGILERGEKKAFVLMTDGFWENIYEREMLETLRKAKTPKGWLNDMEEIVINRADMDAVDNYSAICVIVDA